MLTCVAHETWPHEGGMNGQPADHVLLRNEYQAAVNKQRKLDALKTRRQR